MHLLAVFTHDCKAAVASCWSFGAFKLDQSSVCHTAFISAPTMREYSDSLYERVIENLVKFVWSISRNNSYLPHIQLHLGHCNPSCGVRWKDIQHSISSTFILRLQQTMATPLSFESVEQEAVVWQNLLAIQLESLLNRCVSCNKARSIFRRCIKVRSPLSPLVWCI